MVAIKRVPSALCIVEHTNLFTGEHIFPVDLYLTPTKQKYSTIYIMEHIPNNCIIEDFINLLAELFARFGRITPCGHITIESTIIDTELMIDKIKVCDGRTDYVFQINDTVIRLVEESELRPWITIDRGAKRTTLLEEYDGGSFVLSYIKPESIEKRMLINVEKARDDSYYGFQILVNVPKDDIWYGDKEEVIKGILETCKYHLDHLVELKKGEK